MGRAADFTVPFRPGEQRLIFPLHRLATISPYHCESCIGSTSSDLPSCPFAVCPFAGSAPHGFLLLRGFCPFAGSAPSLQPLRGFCPLAQVLPHRGSCSFAGCPFAGSAPSWVLPLRGFCPLTGFCSFAGSAPSRVLRLSKRFESY